MVKWLTNITISETESQSYYHFFDNRNLHSITPERADREGWWYKPEFIINDLNLNSAITHPVNGSVLRVQLALLLMAVLMPRHHTQRIHTGARRGDPPARPRHLHDAGLRLLRGRPPRAPRGALVGRRPGAVAMSCLHAYRMMIVWLLDWC